MIDYKALAERIKEVADAFAYSGVADALHSRIADLRTVVSLLEGMAEAPDGFALVPKMPSNEVWQEAESAFHRAGAETFRRPGDVRAIWRDQISAAFRVFASTAPHPVSQPQPERQPVSEWKTPLSIDGKRPGSEPTEAQIEARDALLDFISENGTASEGVQHYLDRYVRAALAAKE